MKTFIAAVLLLATSSASAHNSCDLELDAGVHITSNSIEFYDADQPIYKIVEDKYLVVNGQAHTLTDSQAALVTQYATSIRSAIPEVRGMALEGIDLAIEAITLAFDELLGEKNQISTQLTTELGNLKSDVNRYFSSGNPISFNDGNEDTPDFLGKQFETRVERIVETSVQNSIGNLMVAMGKEMFTSGGNMEAFEARMNKFGEQMDAKMNARAAGMEARGKKLCSTVQRVDALEEQLKHAIPVVKPFNVIRTNVSESQVAQYDI